ncbi:MAG: hypothetical protein Q8O74_03520 [bacterium]|nr:hypothetical protein [bacterium]
MGYWGELHHEFSWDNLKDKAPRFFLYKGSSNGQLVFRAAWVHDAKDDALQINRIWCDHKVYEKEAGNGNGFFTVPEKWIDMTATYIYAEP